MTGPLFDVALNTGLTETQLRDLTAVLRACLGHERGDRAAEILDHVFAAHWG